MFTRWKVLWIDDFDKFAYLLLPDAFNVLKYQGFPYVIGCDQIKATVMKVDFATEVNVFGPEFWQYTVPPISHKYTEFVVA